LQVRSVALGVRFLLELCILASFAAWAAHLQGALFEKAIIGTVLCVAAAVAWGMLLSPKRRLDSPAPVRLALEAAFFLLAAAALFDSGHEVLALALLLGAIVQRIALAVFR
jgi:hypothetical protein